MSIKKSLKISYYLIILFFFIAIFSTYYLLNLQKSSGNVINIVGRQRMLSQKIAKEFHEFLRYNDEKYLTLLKKDIELYEVSLNALLNGGECPISDKVKVTLPKTKNNEIKNQLLKVSEIWNNYKNSIEKVLKAEDKNNEEIKVEILKVDELSIPILKEMDLATRQFAETATNMNKYTQFLQLFLFIIVILLSIKAFKELKIFSEKIMKFESIIKLAAGYDLKNRYSIKKIEDEFDNMGNLCNKLFDNLEQIVINIKTSAKEILRSSNNFSNKLLEIANASKENTKAIENTTAAILEFSSTIHSITENIKNQVDLVNNIVISTTDMSKQIHKIAEGVNEMKDSINQSSAAIVQMSTNINSITNNINELNEILIQSGKYADESNKNMIQTSNNMKEIYNSLNNLLVVMDELNSSSQNIEKIIEVIDDISEQTNLLALNAAIEAARAGDHGKGFAVVADEVRKLAERSASSTKEIVAIINAINEKISKAVEDTKKGVKMAEKGQLATTETANSLKNILSHLNSITKLSAQINNAMSEANEGNNQIINQVEKIKSFMNELNKVTSEQAKKLTIMVDSVSNIEKLSDNIKISMNEQTKGITLIEQSMEKIKNSSQINLKATEKSVTDIIIFNNISEQLNNQIDYFKINENIKSTLSFNENELFVWNDKFSVNVKIIDEQHKRLVKLINELFNALKLGQGDKIINKILNELAEYAVMHFGTEEKYFKEFNYPEGPSHKQIHDNFVKKISETVKDIQDGKVGLSVDILLFLKNWLIEHIGKIDKKYVPYFKEHGLF
ncbi:MAG TPA: bacteriohemerythrin [bacterium]|nr:bacteriohemerythrin [bacterium]HPQ19498.1 bacteriohemerythrin [bacterium]